MFLIYLIVITILVVLVFCLLAVRHEFLGLKRINELKKELERTQEEIAKEKELLDLCNIDTNGSGKMSSGFDEFNRRIAEIKEERKQMILKELSNRGRMQTNHATDLLNVSRATTFRYLEELEKEGKIEQIGVFGRNVEYKIKTK